MCFADGGNRAEIRRILAEFAAHRALELFRDDQADALDGIGHFCDVHGQLHRLVLRQNAPPIQEFAFQQAADQCRLADGEEDMLAAEEERARVVRIAENFSASFKAAAGTTNLSVRPIGSSDFQRRSASR